MATSRKVSLGAGLRSVVVYAGASFKQECPPGRRRAESGCRTRPLPELLVEPRPTSPGLESTGDPPQVNLLSQRSLNLASGPYGKH